MLGWLRQNAARSSAEIEKLSKRLEASNIERDTARSESAQLKLLVAESAARMTEVEATYKEALQMEAVKFEAMQKELHSQAECAHAKLGSACDELLQMKEMLDDTRRTAAKAPAE